MKNGSSLLFNFFLVIGDFLALVAAFVGAYVLRVTLDARPLIEAIPARTYLSVFLGLLPFWIIIFALLGLYDSTINEKRFTELGRLFVGSFIGLLFVVFWNFLSSKPIFPARLVPIYGFMLAFVFLVLFRNIARTFRVIMFAFNRGLTNLLIVGDTKITTELVESLINSRQSGYRIVGVVASQSNILGKHKNVPIFKTFAEAIEKLSSEDIHSIVQTELYKSEDLNQEILSFAQSNHIGYRFTPGNSELFVGNLDVELFRSSIPMIAVRQTALFGWGRVVKRLFDILVSGLLIALTSPLFILITVAEKLSGSGAVFFRQDRLTRFNQKFRLFKFRTQYQKYDGTTPEQAFAMMGKSELAKTYRKNGDFLQDDPRVTPLGKLLRKTSLDELPQLINVFKGDLSMVGPRALIPEELDGYDKRHAILSVKSGVTGLAVVSGRRDISYDERRRLDVYYVQNWSFWLDIVLMLKTIRVVLTGTGAK